MDDDFKYDPELYDRLFSPGAVANATSPNLFVELIEKLRALPPDKRDALLEKLEPILDVKAAE
jgi:hypothetical protein